MDQRWWVKRKNEGKTGYTAETGKISSARCVPPETDKWGEVVDFATGENHCLCQTALGYDRINDPKSLARFIVATREAFLAGNAGSESRIVRREHRENSKVQSENEKLGVTVRLMENHTHVTKLTKAGTVRLFFISRLYD